MWVSKQTFLCFTLMFLSLFSVSQNTSIPDPNFEQALIDLGLDSAPINGVVPTLNISSITNLDVSGKSISNLTGIEDFKALTNLNCNNNLLTTLNVSQNTKLQQLFCNRNALSNLNLDNLTDLQILWCANNQLSAIDVSKNTKLISLVCGFNKLSSLNTTTNINLNVLTCESNSLNVLDVSKNVLLTRLQCSYNQISNLDLALNKDLVYLYCDNNTLSSLILANNILLNTLNCYSNNLTELDVSQNKDLTSLNCRNNALCLLNLKNGSNVNLTAVFDSNINLNCVVVDNPSALHTNWNPSNFSNYVTAQDQCKNFVNVDTLNTVITNTNYTLPPLNFGNYYTQSGKKGTPLFAGDVITNSQVIYIYNESACATNETYFSVIITSTDYYIPKYFTPNNDGIHDYWSVRDFNNTINTIMIFDKYGKLLKSLPSNTLGWNGVFNGNLLISDTYWYSISLNSGEIITGHFALKR